MKIRHKQSGVELEGEFEDAGLVFIQRVLNPAALPSMYSKQHWEEVKPAPKWVDVTKDCRAVEPGGIYTQRIWIDDKAFVAQIVNCDFRFRKIDIRPWGNEQQDAFIIEQRQS